MIESIIFFVVMLETLGSGIDVDFLILLIVGGLVGSFCAFFSLHGARQKDVGYDKSHEEFTCLVDKARQEILIATDLDPNTFGSDRVLKHLSEAKNRGCSIRVVYDERAQIEDAPKLAKLQDRGVISIKKAEHELNMHFVVIDGQHVRLDSHPFQEFGKEETEGKVLMRTLELGRKYRRRFDEMWK